MLTSPESSPDVAIGSSIPLSSLPDRILALLKTTPLTEFNVRRMIFTIGEDTVYPTAVKLEDGRVINLFQDMRHSIPADDLTHTPRADSLFHDADALPQEYRQLTDQEIKSITGVSAYRVVESQNLSAAINSRFGEMDVSKH